MEMQSWKIPFGFHWFKKITVQKHDQFLSSRNIKGNYPDKAQSSPIQFSDKLNRWQITWTNSLVKFYWKTWGA